MVVEAVGAVTEESDSEVKFYVAAAAQDLGCHDLAFPLLRDLIPDDRVVPEAPRLLVAADALGEDDFVLDYCRRLRANSVLDWRFVSHEAQTLHQYNATDRAVAILHEFLAARTDDPTAKYARVVLSDIGMSAGRPELVEKDFNLLSSVEEVGAAWGDWTVRVIRQSDPTTALRYAYKLVRRFFDRPEAHRALVASMMPGGTRIAVLPAHSTVDDDSAVRYRERGKLEDDWWVIETERDPDVARREIAPSHAIAQALRNKTAEGGPASEFFINRNNIQDRIGDVAEILDKHVYRLRDSAEHYRERFPDEPFFILGVRAIKTDGTVDVEPIQRTVEQRAEHLRQAERHWQTLRLPVAWLATGLGQPVAAAVEYLAGRKGIRQWCCLGGLEELEASVAAVAKAKVLVLDPTALSSLFLSGAYKSIKAGPLILIASAGTVAEFQRLRNDEQPTPESVKRSLGYVDGRWVWTEPDAEVQRRAAEELDRFLKWLSANVRVEDGLDLAKVPQPTRQGLLKNVGRPTAESLVLAERPDRVLWTDDVWLALGARAANKSLTNAWSQVALRDLACRGQADLAAIDLLATWLIRAEFFFVRVFPDAIVRAAEQSSWKSAVEPLRTMIRVFGIAETEPVGLLFFTARTLKHVLERAPDFDRGAEVVGGILDHVSLVTGGRFIIGRLLSQHVDLFWPDTKLMIAADLAIQRWLIRRQWPGSSHRPR